jgi:hypothetical protein
VATDSKLDPMSPAYKGYSRRLPLADGSI